MKKFEIGDWVEVIDEKFLEIFTDSHPAYSKIDGIYNGKGVPDTRFISNTVDKQNFVAYQAKYNDKENARYWARIRNSDHLFNSKQIRKLSKSEIKIVSVLLS